MAAGRKSKPQSAPQELPIRGRAPVEGPLVFISHDSRDADLAEAFGNLLTDASGGILKSFRSSDRKGNAGIEFGAEWYVAIMQKLDDATDVVALLTSRSLNRPWILYETGVAKGKLESPVFGLALGVALDDAATGPFAQFQNSADDEDSITTLVLQLIRRNPKAAPREEAVRRQVQAFRENVAAILKGRKEEPAKALARAEDTSVAKLFEEVKVLVRDVPDRVATHLGSDPVMRRRRKRRFHPMMIDEIFRHPALRDSPDGLSTGLLILTSQFRDETPWLYELGRELALALSQDSSSAIRRATERFERALAVMSHSSMTREFMDSPEDEEAFITMRHVIHDVEHLIHEMQTAKLKRQPSQEPGRSVADLELSVRARKALQRLNINNIEDLALYSADDLRAAGNLGETTISEIQQQLNHFGLTLRSPTDRGSS